MNTINICLNQINELHSLTHADKSISLQFSWLKIMNENWCYQSIECEVLGKEKTSNSVFVGILISARMSIRLWKICKIVSSLIFALSTIDHLLRIAVCFSSEQLSTDYNYIIELLFRDVDWHLNWIGFKRNSYPNLVLSLFNNFLRRRDSKTEKKKMK